MTANTRQSSNVNGNPSPSTPSPEASTNKTSIRMAAHGPLTALHALAESYRNMMDLLKEARAGFVDKEGKHHKGSIELLLDFTKAGYEAALDAAKDSKKALYMQAGASIGGGVLSVAGAAYIAKAGSAQKQIQSEAAGKQDFLERIKSRMSNNEVQQLSANHGNAVATANTMPTATTSRAMVLIRENNFDELYRCNKTVAPGQADHITTTDIKDAIKLVRVGASPLLQHDAQPALIASADIIKNISNQITVQSNTMHTASNDLARLDASNKSKVDLLTSFVQGGGTIGQAQYSEIARQEEAEVAKLSQNQRMADQAQADFGEGLRKTAQDLSEVIRQTGNITPMRG